MIVSIARSISFASNLIIPLSALILIYLRISIVVLEGIALLTIFTPLRNEVLSVMNFI